MKKRLETLIHDYLHANFREGYDPSDLAKVDALLAHAGWIRPHGSGARRSHAGSVLGNASEKNPVHGQLPGLLPGGNPVPPEMAYPLAMAVAWNENFVVEWRLAESLIWRGQVPDAPQRKCVVLQLREDLLGSILFVRVVPPAGESHRMILWHLPDATRFACNICSNIQGCQLLGTRLAPRAEVPKDRAAAFDFALSWPGKTHRIQRDLAATFEW